MIFIFSHLHFFLFILLLIFFISPLRSATRILVRGREEVLAAVRAVRFLAPSMLVSLWALAPSDGHREAKVGGTWPGVALGGDAWPFTHFGWRAPTPMPTHFWAVAQGQERPRSHYYTIFSETFAFGPPRRLGHLPTLVIHGKAAGSSMVLTQAGNVTCPP